MGAVLIPVTLTLFLLSLLSPSWNLTPLNRCRHYDQTNPLMLVRASMTNDQDDNLSSSKVLEKDDPLPPFIPISNDDGGEHTFCVKPPYIPPAKDEFERKRRIIIDELLHTFWNPSSGFHTKKGETEEMDRFLIDAYGRENSGAGANGEDRTEDDKTLKSIRGENPSTYGEVTTIGGRQLFDVMGLYNVSSNDNNSGESSGFVFYDLGSGTGKLVAHAALEIPPQTSSSLGLKKSVGIELSESRHDMAVSSWSNLLHSLGIDLTKSSTTTDTIEEKKEDKDHNDDTMSMIRHDIVNASFIQGSFLDVDLSDATHVFIASLCMGSDLLWHLANKLASACPNLEVVATMRQFQERKNSIEDGIPVLFQDALSKVVDIQTTWTRGSGRGQTTYVYYLNTKKQQK